MAVRKIEAADPITEVALALIAHDGTTTFRPSGSAVIIALESIRYHLLFLFNDHGACVAAKRRPGNVSSADDWEELLVSEIARAHSDAAIRLASAAFSHLTASALVEHCHGVPRCGGQCVSVHGLVSGQAGGALRNEAREFPPLDGTLLESYRSMITMVDLRGNEMMAIRTLS